MERTEKLFNNFFLPAQFNRAGTDGAESKLRKKLFLIGSLHNRKMKKLLN